MAAVPRETSFMIALEEDSPMQFDRCRCRLDAFRSYSCAIWLPGSPAASRRSISARLTCWHVLHFLLMIRHPNLTQPLQLESPWLRAAAPNYFVWRPPTRMLNG